MKITKRRLLLTLTGIVFSGSHLNWAMRTLSSFTTEDPIIEFNPFSNESSAVELGKSYVKGLGRTRLSDLSGAVHDSLMRKSRESADIMPVQVYRSEELSAQIASIIRADFAEGRLVCVEGWLLSESEARLCGIAYLKRRRLL